MREPAERRYEHPVALAAQGGQVVGSGLVRRRIVDGPVVRLDGRLLAAQLADALRAAEGLVACAQIDRVRVDEPGVR